MLFSSFLREKIPCSFCDNGILCFNDQKTIKRYFNPEVFNVDVENVETMIDTIMNEVMIFDCNNCNAEVAYTYAELARLARKVLKKHLIEDVILGRIKIPFLLKGSNYVMIYCGKCQGYNGRGACPVSIYDNCGVKRLPIC
jgi:hypothetical protein